MFILTRLKQNKNSWFLIRTLTRDTLCVYFLSTEDTLWVFWRSVTISRLTLHARAVNSNCSKSRVLHVAESLSYITFHVSVLKMAYTRNMVNTWNFKIAFSMVRTCVYMLFKDNFSSRPFTRYWKVYRSSCIIVNPADSWKLNMIIYFLQCYHFTIRPTCI